MITLYLENFSVPAVVEICWTDNSLNKQDGLIEQNNVKQGGNLSQQVYKNFV